MSRSELQKSFEAFKNCQSEAEKQKFLSAQKERIESSTLEESKAEIKAIAEELQEMLQTLKTGKQKKAA